MHNDPYVEKTQAKSAPQSQQQGNQITQNMGNKYTVLPEIKMLQDRLQDMYTNRSDIVNVTGDGFAAAHKNEIKEMRWVYLKGLKHIVFYGSAFGIFGGLIVSLMAGVLFEVGISTMSTILAVVAAVMFWVPFGYLLYAEVITEESGQWAIGPNTKQFFNKMKLEMSITNSTVWTSVGLITIAILFAAGLMEVPLENGMTKFLKLFKIIVPEHLQADVLSNGELYGVAWFAIILGSFWLIRKKLLEKIKHEAGVLAERNSITQQSYKDKDSVSEARKLFINPNKKKENDEK